MNAPLFILIAWFAVGVFCVIVFLWYMKTHEKQLLEEIPAAQIFGCIPPPAKWLVVFLFLFFGPILLLWSLCEAIKDWRKEKDENAPGEPRVAAPAPAIAPQTAWMVLFGLFGAGLTAYHWASACPAKPVAEFWEDQARTMGFWLLVFVLPGVLANRKKAVQALRFPLLLIPLYLVGLVPPVVSMTSGWEGGWILGIAGAAAGATAGAAMGRLFNRWIVPEHENPPSERVRAVMLPIVFAVVFACYGAHNWASVWLTPDYAWAIVLFPLVFAFLGALVGRPFLSMFTAFPLAVVQLVPLVALLTVGWEGGWIPGIAGAAVGAAAGAMNGWLYNRWIMPEYDKRRARERAARPPGSTDGPGSSGSMAQEF